MKFQGVLVTDLSGKLGGAVAARNRFGPYLREKVIPVNPGSSFQQDVRAYIGVLTTRWSTVLTAAERQAFDDYAAAVPKVIGGSSVILTGLNWYVAMNLPRLQAALSIIDTAPSQFTTGTPMTNFGVARNAATQNWNVSYTPAELDADPPVNAEALLVWASAGFSPSRNFFKGPHRFMGSVAATVGGPASPTSIASPFPIVSGLKYGFYGRMLYTDGRISIPFSAFSTVA